MKKNNDSNDPDPPLIQIYEVVRIIFAVFIFIVMVVAGTISRKFPDGLFLGLFLGITLTGIFWFVFGMNIDRARTAYKQLPVLLSQIKQTREIKARGIIDPRLPKFDFQDKLSILCVFLCSFTAVMLLMPWWADTLKEDIPRAQAFCVLIGCAIVIGQLFYKRRVTGKTALIAALVLILGVGFALSKIFQIW